MARYHHTEGICLRTIDYSNTSQVASFLTPDVGRLSVMAKGVTRAPKKGVRTGFGLLRRYELIYTTRQRGSLQNLTYRWLREDFPGMQGALERILCGYYAAELVSNFTAELDPCPSLYGLLLKSLRNFATGKKLGVNVLLLELGVLREQGFCPTFDACAGCGRALPGRGSVLFSPAMGGPLCSRCERDAPVRPNGPVIRTRAGLLKALAGLRPGPDEKPPSLAPGRTLALSALLRFHMREVLGKELRMWDYLQRQKLSRSLHRLRRAQARQHSRRR